MFQPPAQPMHDDLSRRLNSGPDISRVPPQGIPAPPPKANEPGEFTKMFAAPLKPQQPTYNPNVANYADKLYAPPPIPGGGMPPVQPPAAPPPGGSEFTRAMQRISFGELAPLPQQQKPKQTEEPPPPKSSGRLPVVLVVVGVIVVLAIVLVLMLSLSSI